MNGQPDLGAVPAPLQPLLAAALARDPARRPLAVQLSARAAVLDPDALVQGPVLGLGEGMGARPTAVQADLAFDVLSPAGDAFPGAAIPVDPRGGLPGVPGPAAADLGAVSPGTRPFVPGRPLPAEFADVLPPVEYQPERWPNPGPGTVQPAAPGSQFAARDIRSGEIEFVFASIECPMADEDQHEIVFRFGLAGNQVQCLLEARANGIRADQRTDMNAASGSPQDPVGIGRGRREARVDLGQARGVVFAPRRLDAGFLAR